MKKGYCQCGCGRKTNIIKKDVPSKELVKGKYRKYVLGHNRKGKIGLSEDKHHSWKGDDVGYSGLHYWVVKNKGKPNYCEECGTKNAKAYHWANISGKYKRDLNDFKRLCIQCHMKFDSDSLVRGEANNKAKLKEKQVIKIRKLYKTNKYSRKELQNMFKVSKTCIAHIIKRKTWKHI